MHTNSCMDIRIKNTYHIFMTAKEVLKLLKRSGWYVHETKGSHCQLKHSEIQGKNNNSHAQRRFEARHFE